VTSSQGCPQQVGRGDFPVQLATRLPDWSAGGLLRCSAAARLSVCRCRSPKSTSTTRTTCCGHPREDVTRMLRGKLLPWNLSLTALLDYRPNQILKVYTSRCLKGAITLAVRSDFCERHLSRTIDSLARFNHFVQ